MRDLLVALSAALLGSAVEALGRFAWNGPYLPELMAGKFFAQIPVWAFTPLFRTFGRNSKYLAFGGMIAAEVAGLTLLGLVLRQWMRGRPRAGGKTWWLVAGIASPIAIVILVALLPLLDAGVAGRALLGGVWITVPSVVLVVGCYVTLLLRGAPR
jgi:hypothetical protein